MSCNTQIFSSLHFLQLLVTLLLTFLCPCLIYRTTNCVYMLSKIFLSLVFRLAGRSWCSSPRVSSVDSSSSLIAEESLSPSPTGKLLTTSGFYGPHCHESVCVLACYALKVHTSYVHTYLQCVTYTTMYNNVLHMCYIHTYLQ